MASPEIAAVILAAGMGTRMKSARHKVLHPVGGRAMIDHLLATLDRAGAERRVFVVGALRDQLEDHLGDADFAVQEPQQGTGHAVLCAREALAGFDGEVVILYGDVPFVRAETLDKLVAARRAAGGDGPGLAVLGFRAAEPGAYGRLIAGPGGGLDRIVEAKDATEGELRETFCNSGIMAAACGNLFDLLSEVTNDNAKGEYYLTDIVALARQRGQKVVTVEAGEEEVMGVNSRAELAAAEAAFQESRRLEAMEAGVTLVDPASVHFSADTEIAPDAVVEPYVVFGPGVSVGAGATVKSFSHLEGATVAAGATVGPFARLRPGANIGAGAKIGNFVEIKKADIEEGAKVSHLSYIGDACIGAGANVGAGTITCNYDGFGKHFTDIGAGAFIGSNTALVAPVKVGEGAIIGAGSTLSKDVEADALAIERSEEKQLPGWAAKFRARQEKKDG